MADKGLEDVPESKSFMAIMVVINCVASQSMSQPQGSLGLGIARHLYMHMSLSTY